MEEEIMPTENGGDSGENDANKIILQWEAPEFIHHDRDVKWYILAVFLTIILLGYAIYSRDWFFIGTMVLILVGAVVYLKTPPKIRGYAIAELGIYIDDKFFSFSSLHSFWIIYEEKVKTLNFAFNKKYLPALTIQIGDQNPVQIKELLKKHLPEEEKRTETIGDQLIRKLKF